VEADSTRFNGMENVKNRLQVMGFGGRIIGKISVYRTSLVAGFT